MVIQGTLFVKLLCNIIKVYSIPVHFYDEKLAWEEGVFLSLEQLLG